MNFFRLFFRNSVDKILSSITKNIEALRAHAQAEEQRKAKKVDQANILSREADGHALEMTRADSVADKLEALIS